MFSYFHNFVAKSDQKPEMMKDERNKYLVKSKEMAELNTSFEKKNYPNVYLFVVLLLTVFYNLIAFKPNWLANFQIIILITLSFFWSTSNLFFFSLELYWYRWDFESLIWCTFWQHALGLPPSCLETEVWIFFQQNFRWEINLYLLKNKISYSAKKTIGLMMILD